MRFGALENSFRTLRFRLTFWNTSMILVLLTVTLVGLRVGLRWMLQRDLDAVLSDDVVEVQQIVERHWPDLGPIAEELNRKAVTHSGRTWFARILGQDGTIRWASTNTPDLPPPPVHEPGTRPFDLGDYRLAERRVPRPDGTLVVRVGSSRSEMDENLVRLSEMLLVAAIVILVVAPLGGYWLAGRATRPLAGIHQTAARLRPDHLVERLPLRGSGDELDQLSATINGLLDRLAEHLQRQREFVANAAHELRSPLAAMRTSVDVALAHDRAAEEYRDLLGDLAEECSSLGGLINNLLLLAEGDSGLLPANTESDLAHVASRAADMFGGVAEQRGIELVVGPLMGAPVFGCDMHLREVVHNLLDNALKFTPAGGRVELKVERDRGPGKGWARLQVRDTGCGIPAANLPHVFDRFYRGDKARCREAGRGTGLGLSICQSIVTACGGRITLDSQEGKGTTATVLLPLAD